MALRRWAGNNGAVPPATGPALIILVAFLLPGFVTVLIQERTYKFAQNPTPLDRLLQIVYYSVWTYLLLGAAALIFHVHRGDVEHLYTQDESNPAELVWRAALIILVPSFLIATATRVFDDSRLHRWLLERAKINARHQQPTGWDYFFRQGRGAYVRVTFPEGGRVYGYYGGDSFAAYAKDGRDLYLEKVCAEEDDWFGPAAGDTCGVWIKAQDAVSIEFYSPPHDTTSATPTGAAPGPENTEGNGP